MLKKVLMLTLILAAGSVTPAMTLQISANGILNPVDSEINLIPSQTVMLDIWSPDGYQPGDDVYFGLVCDPAYGSISGGVSYIQHPGRIVPYEEIGSYFLPLEGIYGFIGDIQPIPPGVYFGEITFHCEAFGEAVIKLITTLDFENFTLADQLVIHQLPEPATAFMLIAGAVVLLRKR
jgi:hypothetical protein